MNEEINLGEISIDEDQIQIPSINIPLIKGDKGDTGAKGDDGQDYVITSSDYQEIADIVLDDIEIPTKVSDLDNDEGFIDNTVNDLENYTKTSDLADVATSGSYNDLSNTPSIPSKTSDLTNDSGFIDNTYHDSTKQDALTAGDNITIENNVISATGGGSSDYSNLTNKPSINSVTLSGNKTTSDLGLGTYSKPSNGIPKTDLASDVQTSLGKADTAIQEHQDISGKQDITDNNLTTTNKTIPTAINEVNSIAKGANQALSYSNYSAMITTFNSLANNVYNVGQNVMIVTLNVPDLWISSVESTSSTYTYTTDSAFISALSTNGYVQVGYYKLSALETQKVDLTDYVKNTDYATSSTAGVIKTGTSYGTTMASAGTLRATAKTYVEYSSAGNYMFIGKGTLENVITGKGLVSDTDYATSSKGGTIRTSNASGLGISNGNLYAVTKAYNTYNSASDNMFIGKGTLENVITGKGLIDTSKVKTTTNTTQGNVYDVTYINTMIGDVETVLTTLTTGGGVNG